MTNYETNTNATGYMAEYFAAFQSVPHTHQTAEGQIVDMATRTVVEVPATHPDYRTRYGAQAVSQAVHQSFNQGGEV